MSTVHQVENPHLDNVRDATTARKKRHNRETGSIFVPALTAPQIFKKRSMSEGLI